jgi:hypothetical protein
MYIESLTRKRITPGKRATRTAPHHSPLHSDPECLKAKRNKKLESSKCLMTLRPAKLNLFVKLLECMMFPTVFLLQGELDILPTIYHIFSSRYVLRSKNNS